MVANPPSESPGVEAVLERIRALSARFAAVAEQTDQSPHPPVEHLQQLAAAGLFRLPVPAALGGLEAPERLWEVTEALSRGCGLTQFLQTQHQSALTLVARSDNAGLRRDVLPDLMSGRRFAGVAIAHLRRPRAVSVVWAGERLTFHGQVPWFTGWGVMDSMVLAGVLPDGRYLYAFVPTAGLRASPAMKLCAMSAASTVSLALERFEVDARNVVLLQTPAEMREADAGRVLRHSAQPLGVVQAAVLLLRGRPEDCAQRAADRFGAQADALRERARRFVEGGDSAPAYRIRAEANALAVRCAQAALVASGGGGMDLGHPAQRLVREAMFYTLTQLDGQLKDEALAVLSEANI